MPLWKRICCAVDFSEPSRAALVAAASLARELQASLVVLHVVPPARTGAPFAPPPRGHARQSDDRLAAWTRSADLIAPGRATSVQLSGAAADEIVRFAAEAGCDLVVLGTRRRRGVRRLLGGKVSEKVARASERPVLVVRDDGEIATWSGRAGVGHAPPLDHQPGLP